MGESAVIWAVYCIGDPDFTPPDRNGFIVKYGGMMFVSDYGHGIFHRQLAIMTPD